MKVLSTKNKSLGAILVSAGGRALYHTAAEKKHVVKCTGGCAARWVPLVIARGVRPISGPGVIASMLGTVKRPDGRLQVTYDGFPLYLFSGDTRPGEVNGQGAGGVWHAIAPSGFPVTKGAGSAPTGAGMDRNPDYRHLLEWRLRFGHGCHSAHRRERRDVVRSESQVVCERRSCHRRIGVGAPHRRRARVAHRARRALRRRASLHVTPRPRGSPAQVIVAPTRLPAPPSEGAPGKGRPT